MEQEEGLRLLAEKGWLSATPADFRQAILSRCSWERLKAGDPIQVGGEEQTELIGVADGIVEMRSVLGRPDTPIMHLAHPVLWLGYGPIAFDRPRPTAASARTATVMKTGRRIDRSESHIYCHLPGVSIPWGVCLASRLLLGLDELAVGQRLLA